MSGTEHPNAPKKPHLSPSQVNRFGFCEQQYHFSHILKIKMPPGVALLKGSGVHKAAEVNFKQKIESKVDLPEKDLMEIAAGEFDSRIMAEGLALDPDEEARGHKVVIGEAKDSTIGLTGTFYHYVAPIVQPAIVEAQVRILLPDSSHDMLGRLDVATVDDEVLDMKSGGKHKPQTEADTNVGLTFYGIAYKILTGKTPSLYALDSITEGKQPHKRLTTERTPGDAAALLARMNHMLRRLKEGSDPKPAPIGHFLCTPKFCGYWKMCPYVNSERKAAADA